MGADRVTLVTLVTFEAYFLTFAREMAGYK
jgi:hypothetical protein